MVVMASAAEQGVVEQRMLPVAVELMVSWIPARAVLEERGRTAELAELAEPTVVVAFREISQGVEEEEEVTLFTTEDRVYTTQTQIILRVAGVAGVGILHKHTQQVRLRSAQT